MYWGCVGIASVMWTDTFTCQAVQFPYFPNTRRCHDSAATLLTTLADEDAQRWTDLLNKDINKPFQDLIGLSGCLGDGVDAILKMRVSELEKAANICEETSLGMYLGGDHDWKASIEHPNDLEHVSAIAVKTLDRVEGQTLGLQIDELVQASQTRIPQDHALALFDFISVVWGPCLHFI